MCDGGIVSVSAGDQKRLVENIFMAKQGKCKAVFYATFSHSAEECWLGVQ